MSAHRLDRRSFLKGLGVSAGMLPLVSTDLARGAAFPRRLLVIFFSNGVIPENFWPTGSQTDFVMGEILKPLEPYKSKVLILGGVDMTSRVNDTGVIALGHDSTAAILTARKYAVFKFPSIQAGGVSLDQYVANELQKTSPTPIHSLVVGARASGVASLSWRGASDPVTWENDPQKLFARLFTNGTPMSDAAIREHAANKSILDFLSRDLSRFGQRLGTEDRQKIDAHLASIRAVETELARLAAARSACSTPTLRPVGNRSDAALLPDTSKAQFDLIAAAFRCNLTRVVTFKWGQDSDNGQIYPWLGTEFSGAIDSTDEKGYIRDHHDMGHVAYKTAETKARKTRVDKWYYEMIRYMVDRLAETPEGDGTMLDNTAVLVTSNMCDGSGHGMKGIPWVVIGSCGGYFKTGRWLKFGAWTKGSSVADYYKGKGPPYPFGWLGGYDLDHNFTNGVPHNGLLVSLANAMGVPTQTFGDPAYGSGGLPGLTG